MLIFFYVRITTNPKESQEIPRNYYYLIIWTQYKISDPEYKLNTPSDGPKVMEMLNEIIISSLNIQSQSKDVTSKYIKCGIDRLRKNMREQDYLITAIS
jgi:hypothetical protein